MKTALDLLNNFLVNVWFKRAIGIKRSYVYICITKIDPSSRSVYMVTYRPHPKSTTKFSKNVYTTENILNNLDSYIITDESDKERIEEAIKESTKYNLKH